MGYIFGIAQNWWSIAGLVCDIVGFSIIAIELFITTRLHLVLHSEKPVEQHWSDLFEKTEVISKFVAGPECASRTEWLQLRASLAADLREFEIAEVQPEIRRRAALLWPMPFRVAKLLNVDKLSDPPRDRHAFDMGVNPHLRLHAAWRRVDAFVKYIRQLVLPAILAILIGFALQIAGAWPIMN